MLNGKVLFTTYECELEELGLLGKVPIEKLESTWISILNNLQSKESNRSSIGSNYLYMGLFEGKVIFNNVNSLVPVCTSLMREYRVVLYKLNLWVEIKTPSGELQLLVKKAPSDRHRFTGVLNALYSDLKRLSITRKSGFSIKELNSSAYSALKSFEEVEKSEYLLSTWVHSSI